MFSGNVQKIFDEIMSDKENEKFTKAGIKPLFSAPKNARVMIVGQAPGIKAQEAGKYWFDKSGDRLREWMGVDEKTFYESDILKKIREVYLDNLRNNFSVIEFENILGKYNRELEKIKRWLNDVAKEYLKNNFKQEELRNYWFGSYKDMPVIIESGE